MEEKYFVGSDGEQPIKIFFSPLEAFVSGCEYIDSFDEAGNIVKSYKFVDSEYTDNF
jgi:hypothetical protein